MFKELDLDTSARVIAAPWIASKHDTTNSLGALSGNPADLSFTDP